jgi:hypothetical protein
MGAMPRDEEPMTPVTMVINTFKVRNTESSMSQHVTCNM